MNSNLQPEESLDPKDWSLFRALAHEMVDDALDYLQEVRERPVWQPIPEGMIDFLSQPVPHKPEGEAAVYEVFKEKIFPYTLGNIHPRFWGWVVGTGVPYAVMAEMLAAVMNPNMGNGEHVPYHVERQVVDWCKEIMGFPADASGILVSGGSMSNFVGLAVARNVMAGYDVRKEGVGGDHPRMTVYASAETHSCNFKALELLGIGKQWVRLIPVDTQYKIDQAPLEAAIAADKAAGLRPICVIGNAGTVNTGAFDDLNALADICEREELWFHVDGAFGALAAVSEATRHLTAGMDRADSLGFDLHKWMYLPIEIACVLVRKFDHHVGTFAVSPDYLSHMARGMASGDNAWFSDLGVQLTRGFRALKAWMTIKAYGLDAFGRLIAQNVAQAQYLASLVAAHPKLELLAGVPMNIVCFRYIVPGVGDTELNDLNQEVLMRLQEQGLAAPSYTRLNGKFAIRAAITNHRSRWEDFEFLVEQVGMIGDKIVEITDTW